MVGMSAIEQKIFLSRMQGELEKQKLEEEEEKIQVLKRETLEMDLKDEKKMKNRGFNTI